MFLHAFISIVFVLVKVTIEKILGKKLLCGSVGVNMLNVNTRLCAVCYFR